MWPPGGDQGNGWAPGSARPADPGQLTVIRANLVVISATPGVHHLPAETNY
jgi:hypothetical protein